MGWGRIVLAASASASRAGTAWTDHGTSRQERGLKHRADNETRAIPIPPELVRLLRAHIKRCGPARGVFAVGVTVGVSTDGPVLPEFPA
jgi:imidazolonepropionase-like amidohydrolase